MSKRKLKLLANYVRDHKNEIIYEEDGTPVRTIRIESLLDTVRENTIYNHFSQFGSIDKVRIVDEIDHTASTSSHNKSNNNYQRYALVTFATAKSSYNARLRKSHSIGGRNYWIRMADSCYQERREENLDALNSPSDMDTSANPNEISETPIPQLNDDCLLKIFSYLDIHALSNMVDVSEHFNYLIHQQSRRKITFNFPPTTHSNLEKCLRQFGNNITHLTLDFGHTIHSMTNRKVHTQHNKQTVVRIFQKIQTYVDFSKLIYLRIESMVVTPAIFAVIEPLLGSLQVLKIKSLRCAEAEEEVELPTLCSRLTKLKLIGTILLDKSSAVNWPSLTTLSVLDNYNLRASTMSNFLANNPQLRRLRISCGLYDNINFNNLLEDTLKYQTSPGLEKLTYEDKWNGKQTTVFYISEQFGQLKTLKKLNLCFRFNYINDDNIKTITQLTGLTHLTLSYNFNLNAKQIIRPIKSHHLISIGNGLPNLEVFHLHGFQPSESAIVEFVKCAKNLRLLNIRGCMRPLHYEFHQNILNANSNVVIC